MTRDIFYRAIKLRKIKTFFVNSRVKIDWSAEWKIKIGFYI